MEKGIYQFKIRARDVDFCKQATLVSMVDYILEAAGIDADVNGFGVSALNKDNHSWVLSRMSLELSYIPVEAETFHVTTWVNEVGRMMTTRNMIICNDKGERIGAAVTCWAMIDLESRRALDLSSNENYLSAVVDEQSPIVHPCKVRSVSACVERDYRVVYSDIDFNSHTNTMKYLEMMFDTMTIEQLISHKFRRMDINFIHESRYGDTLTIKMCNSEEMKTCFEITNSDASAICRAQVEWL